VENGLPAVGVHNEALELASVILHKLCLRMAERLEVGSQVLLLDFSQLLAGEV